MKTKWLVFLLLIMVTLYSGSGNDRLELNQGVEDLNFLSQLEKEVVKELNLARTAPGAYVEYLIDFKRFYIGKHIRIAGRTPVVTQEGATAVNEAIDFLQNVEPVSPLYVSKGLSLAAKSHVEDQGPEGLMSHQGSDNSSPIDRMMRYGKVRGAYGENIGYGEFSAREIVMQLIIDDGVQDRGHRDYIFKDDFKVVGVACGDHKAFGTMCVMDFAGKYIEDKNSW
jgi:uncharacterized protein YkwD